MRTILLLATLLFFCPGCSTDELEAAKESQTKGSAERDFQGEIKSAYFENWISGVRGGGAGTRFYIELKEPLSPEISFTQLYFKGNRAKVYALSEVLYIANFTNNYINSGDIVFSDADAGKMTIRVNTPIPIAEDEALLEYFANQGINYYIISKISERELVNEPE